MKILDDIKAKREAATCTQWYTIVDIDALMKLRIGDLDYPLPDIKDIEFIARMDPRTVEAMENVCRAAENKEVWSKIDCPACTTDNPSEGVPCYCFDHRDAYEQLEQALEALKQIDKD